MPHSTRASSQSRGAPNFKFPGDTTKPSVRTSMEKSPDVDFHDGQSPYSASPIRTNGSINGAPPVDRWQPRQDSNARAFLANANSNTGGGHGRQKSLSDAFKTIRTRRASVSANVHEISDALKAPLSPKLIVCTPQALVDGCDTNL